MAAHPLQSRFTQKRTNDAPAADGKPAVVLFPGGPGFSSRTLGTLADSLAAREVSCFSVDPPGTGGLPEEAEYSFDRIVDSLERELLSLREPLVLLGHSFGGLYVSALLARGKLAELRGLVFLSAPITVTAYAAIQELFTGQTSEASTRAHEFLAAPSEAGFRAWIDALCAFYFRGEERIRRGRELLAQDRTSYRCFLQVYPETIGQLESRRLGAAIAHARLPKLLIAGEEDRLVPTSLLAGEARRLGAQYEVLPGAGHFGGIDQPDRAAQTVVNFIAGI